MHAVVQSNHRIGTIGALGTAAGCVLSGPVAMLMVFLVQPQPAWVSARMFAEHYHWIQSLTFFFGLLLVAGGVLMIAAIFLLDRRGRTLLALVFTAIAGGLIFFNYFTQLTFLPALIENYSPDNDALIYALSMANPLSLAWTLEMWGYGLLGLGTWLAADFFAGNRLEDTARFLFVLNGVLSLAGALYTALDPGWVLTPPGLVAFGVWNLLYFAMAVLMLLILRTRAVKLESVTPA